MRFSLATLALAFTACANAVSINQINGVKYLSPYVGQTLTGIKGLVTAKGPNGFFLRDTSLNLNINSSNSIYVFGASALQNVTVGDIITVDGTVAEFRSTSTYLFLTELTFPNNVKVLSKGNKVQPVVIGQDLFKYPPTEQFSSLDNGDNPAAITKSNRFGNVWIAGSWRTSGKNKRGGLTIRDRDSNPEALAVIDPLDGTKNPQTVKLGDTLEEITGVLTYAFGYYSIYPQTAVKVIGSASPATPPPTNLTSSGTCGSLTFGDYNVENLTPKSAWLPSIAEHITTYLKTPDLLFIQEIQDDNGATNNGVVTANLTLTTLVNAIYNISKVQYAFTEVLPVDKLDGGEPGGNIRQAYLYKPNVIRLRKPNLGGPLDANEVLAGPELKFNPGRIEPSNSAFTASRKPLAAAWETLDGKNKFFTVNLHQGSKGGGSPLQGDARPPINGGVADRSAQSNITATFVAQILKKDPFAKIIVAGDFNEFSFVEPLETFKSVSHMLDLDDVTLTPTTERYTYMFDMNCQELDHMFVSPALILGAAFEHVHVNTWSTLADQKSDHDPSVARLNVCS
ncbi:related to endonuclease/exonuclease/phosphatase family protein [Rhynchosporium agropyri]|uniref:Related to endonuclease/exonuclease/phosphatase family protein n=1 Tax=Rhynchosporium agropyri TaxID=914238 RepID=A0A1E1K4E8_9HELO|nr:related to endonuclease/exonuclease/phosphatase family protein [Rhynchosporium agropyri]